MYKFDLNTVIGKSVIKNILTSIEQNRYSAFKCRLRAQKYLLFIVDDTCLYFSVFV